MSKLTQIILESVVEKLDEQQQHKSAGTSLNQVSAGLKNAPVKEGDVGVDVGGGKYDKGVEHFASKGAKLHVYDPYNRSEAHNKIVEAKMHGKADYVGCHNVLNVIKEKEHRAGVLHKIKQFMGPKGTAHITVYEGDKSGNGRETKGGESWQNHQPTAWYHDEIKKAFPDHTITKHKGGYLIKKSEE